MSGYLEINRDNVKYGILHEIGHILVALRAFPEKELIDCISFEVGSYTNTVFFQYSFDKEQIGSYFMMCLGGGVFQQMVCNVDCLKQNTLRFNADEEEMNKKDSNKAIELFLYRTVKSNYDGMENDIARIDNMLEFLNSKNIQVEYDEGNIKNNTIKLLLPDLFKKRFVDAVDYCTDYILDQIFNRRKKQVIIDARIVKHYLNDGSVREENLVRYAH